jgi:hypothetical protein
MEKPELNKLIFEYGVLDGGIELAKRRLNNGQKLPEHMYKTIYVLTRAYIKIANEYYPEDLCEQAGILGKRLDGLKSLYHSKRTDH